MAGYQVPRLSEFRQGIASSLRNQSAHIWSEQDRVVPLDLNLFHYKQRPWPCSVQGSRHVQCVSHARSRRPNYASQRQ